MNDEPTVWTYVKLALAAGIWGGTFVAGRAAAGELPPLVLASLRFLIAALALLVILRLFGRNATLPSMSQLARVSALGFFGIFLYNICFFYGLERIDASRASLIVAINPAVIAIFGVLFFKEHLTATRWMGLSLCLAGAAVVITARPGQTQWAGNWVGDILILGCVLSWVIYSVFGRRLINEIGALETVTYSIFAGAIMLTASALGSGQVQMLSWEHVTWKSISALLYLGVLGSALAYVFFYDGIRKIGSSRAGSFIALNPLTSVLAGAALLGETLKIQTLIGGLLVIIGLLLSNCRMDLRALARCFSDR